MGTVDKLIQKILAGSRVSYKEAETMLFNLGFELDIASSHHIFRKKSYTRSIVIKKRKELLNYQLKQLKKVLEDHGY